MTAKVYIGNDVDNWNDSDSWDPAGVPTADDDVTIGKLVNLSVNLGITTCLCHDLTINNVGTTALSHGTIHCYGSINFSTAPIIHTCTLRMKSTDSETLSGSSASTASSSFYIDTAGTFTLNGNFTWDGLAYLNAGTFDTDTYTFTAMTITINGSTVTLGSSTITLSGTWTYTSGSLDAETSTINCDGNFYGGGQTYYDVSLTKDGSITITGANTFHDLEIAPITDWTYVSFPANQIITNLLTITGLSAVKRVLILSNLQGTQRTLTAATVALTNCDFLDIVGAGDGSPFTGTSIGDAGNNSGITFTAAVTRYWVGNGGNWTDTAHWDAHSGGAGGDSVPICHDTVIFDASSFSSASQTVTMSHDHPYLGKTIDFSAVDSSPTINFGDLIDNSEPLFICGSLTLASGITITGTSSGVIGYFRFVCRGAFNLTSNGFNFDDNIWIDCGQGVGTLTLQDNFSMSSDCYLFMDSGTLDANDKNMTIGSLVSPYSYTTTSILNMGNGTITIIGANGDYNTIEIDTDTYLTVNGEGSTLVISVGDTSARTIEVNGNVTFNDVTISGASTGIVTLSPSSGDIITIDAFTITNAPKTVKITAGRTITTTTFTANGSSGNLITLRSTSTSTSCFLNADVTSISYVDVQRNTAGGAAIPFDDTLGGVDSGNNVNWLFTSTIPQASFF